MPIEECFAKLKSIMKDNEDLLNAGKIWKCQSSQDLQILQHRIVSIGCDMQDTISNYEHIKNSYVFNFISIILCYT